MNPENMKKISSAATGLAMWVGAMYLYHGVAKEVGPKKAKLEEMNALLNAANAKLAEKQAMLKEVLDKVAMLQQQCDETVAEKNRLVAESEQTALRLVNAEKLTVGLSAEGVRWKETLVTLGKQRMDLIGDAILACACISYYGPFTGIYRNELVARWTDFCKDQGIPCSDDPTLAKTLGDPVRIREWQGFKLPSDDLSTNNGILVTTAKRWPLMIDPQMQANIWIRKMEEKNGLRVTTMADINLLRVVEDCIRNGKPLLIEDCRESLEPAIEPVLQRAVFKEGNRTLIRLGDSNVDYDELFKLYMTTKMPNPHYLPETCIKVTIINFTVTMDGLTDQLLGDVVVAERPEVEEKNAKLIMQMSADKKKLAEIEADILFRLSNSKGNILDDVELIETLASSKRFSTIIKERLQQAEVTEVEIKEARMGYITAAVRGAIIYFVIADLADIDPMYQYSLQFYKELFNKCIADSEKNDDLDTRLATIIEYSTRACYANVCGGLFEKDKVLFSSLLCFQILRNAGEIGANEWSLFVRGAGIVDRSNQPANPQPARISEASWDILYKAESDVGAEGGDEAVRPYAGLLASITQEWDKSWFAWATCDDPINTPLPAPFDKTVNEFQKMICIKVFHEHQMLLACNNYTRIKFGDPLADSPSRTIEEIYAELDNKKPCIFVLSTGADPSGMLFKFQAVMKKKMELVSLGQGQGPVAEQLVADGCKSGDWVLLQNCMLAKSWMSDLEAMVFGLAENSEDNHPEFRLWLTSKPAPYFPVSVLQNGIKMTNEPPKGIRANLVRSYANLIKPEDFETCKMKNEFKMILCGLCFFHANILERRKFGPLGWNIRYAFDESDLETSIAIMRRFLNEQDEIPWDALRFVTGQINYGGRVTDDWDRRCITTILQTSMKEEVLTAGFKFSPSGVYYSPEPGSYEDYKTYFGSLLAVDDPEVFGMHQNANTTFMTAESQALMGSVLSLQPRSGGGGGAAKSPDEIVLEAAAALKEQVPGYLLDDDAGATTFVIQPNGLLTSLATVLKQEMVKFNRLLKRMNGSLSDIEKAIGGFILMTTDLDDMYTSLMNNQVPPIWMKVSFASLKTLGSWMKDTVFRLEFMSGWLVNGLPIVFPLPVFFFPQGFMTGTLQTFARKHMVAIDTLKFKFAVLHDDSPLLEEGPDDGVICDGMFLEGARWDSPSWLVEVSRVGEMFTGLPKVHFAPEVDHVLGPGLYECPVYKTAARKGVLSTTGMSTNFVIAVELPTDVDPDTWIKYGMAALLNLSD